MSNSVRIQMYIGVAKHQSNHQNHRKKLPKHRNLDRSRYGRFLHTDSTRSVVSTDPVGKVESSKPGPVGKAENSKPGPLWKVESSKPDPVGKVENSKPGPVGKVESSKRGPVGKVESSKPGPVGKVESSKPGPVGKVESSKPGPVGKVESSKLDPVGKVESSKPGSVGEVESSKPGPVGKEESSKPGPVGKLENSKPGSVGKVESIQPSSVGKAASTQPGSLGKTESTRTSRLGKVESTESGPVGKVESTQPVLIGKKKDFILRTKGKTENHYVTPTDHSIETQIAKLKQVKDNCLNHNPVLPAIGSYFSVDLHRDSLPVQIDSKGENANLTDEYESTKILDDEVSGSVHLSQVVTGEGDDMGNNRPGNSALSLVGSSDDGEGFTIGVSIRGIDVDRNEYTQVRSSDQNFPEQLRKDEESSKIVTITTDLSTAHMDRQYSSGGPKNSRQPMRMDSGNDYPPVSNNLNLKKGYRSSDNSLSSSVGKLSSLTRSEGSLDGSDKYHDDSRSETTEGGRTNRSDRSSIQGDKKDPQQAQMDSDAKQLFNASKLIGRVHPEDIIIRTCVRRNQKQRMKTKARFEELYELELIPELKSGLGASWHLLIDALLDDRTTSSARAMHDALEEGNYNTAVEILCLSTPQSLATLNDLYNKDYAVSLEGDITDKTEAPEQTLLLALQKGRDESVKVEEKQAEKDADSLYESGDGRWSSDTGPFIKMVCARNFAHIRVVLNLYRVLTGGKDVTEDIKNECSRQYADCLVTMVNCVRGADTYFADKIFKNMSAKDQDFVNMLVARSEIDMPAIKRAYKKKYDAELVDDLKHKCNHPTINVLIELINKIPQGQGKKSKPPVPVGAAKRPIKRPPHAQTKEEEANTPRNPLAAPSQRITAEVVSQRQGQEIAREKEKEAREREKGQKKEKEMMKKNISGTVKPSKSFHPDDDCDKLHDALGKYGTDETQITEILTQRCNVQRQQIKKMYNGKFKQDLQKQLEQVLEGDYEEILMGLLKTPAEYDARCIHEALDGMGSRDGTLLGIIVTRDKQEKMAIADHYKKAYKTDVEDDIRKEDADSDFGNLLVAIWSGERETGSVNQTRAHQEAKMLLRNGKAVHPKDETYTNLMVKSSHAQVKATFLEYANLAGQDIYAGLITAGLGDNEDGYISLAMAVQDPHDFYAEKLNSCFSSMGVNDNMLIRMTVSRSERDLGKIKERLQERYKKSLSQLIRSDCKGDYKQMLLEIIGE
ncbi:annexin A6-like isoform X2 [Pecten maximus]|uniref:annexin A6-like isoform X2 n=1 Tax=Pecten maximus TaxID=6579 RepID=UPI0014590967|nr:annexin A6-like isoform X2 [Pecten maximus]